MLLGKLCNADGISGNENNVRNIIKNEISKYADEIKTDSIGNLLAYKKGKSSEKTLMLCAHTDEVGFIISGITKEGYLEFKTVGGIDTRVIIAKKVRIGNNAVKGVIGIKAVHLTTKDERKKVPKESELYIDIGAKDEDDAKKYVKLGDFAAFDTEFEVWENCIKAKAIDDRVGCYILTELIKNELQYDTCFCFCAQEEVGLRGSKIAAAAVCPDVALVVEGTTCSDVSGVESHNFVTTLGGGAAISFMDRTTIVNKRFYKWLYELGQKNNIKVQYKSCVSGGNDAGSVHLSNSGVLTASVSVPCRYIHSSASIASLSDIDATLKLCEKFLENVNQLF